MVPIYESGEKTTVVKMSAVTGGAVVFIAPEKARAVAWGYENGIIDGVGGNMFAPDAPVTREQMAALIMRYVGFAGITLKPVNETSLFADDAYRGLVSRRRVRLAEGKYFKR